MVGVVLVYAGLGALAAGALSLIRPLRFLAIQKRTHGLFVAVGGILLVILGWLVPAGESRIVNQQTKLDEFAPVFQFNEQHSITVNAPAERVYETLKAVTAGEITFFRALAWIRRLGRSGPESILNAPERKPLLEVATTTGFLLLAEEPGREIVIGTIVKAPRGFKPRVKLTPEDYRTLEEPGFAKATLNFRLTEPATGVTLLTTETRVFATDAATRRGFAAYWRVIYPGSSIIRTMWLRAIQRRAEA